ncbi:hypothetical protein PLEOSDRAFT_1050810 [Pleurotus ostreatus PC15]|uniref:NAD(P)-binding protein n=1 Tax=Pleurotus ostreatus (strain PC15) TaxID=1137138 RepID=A0A067NFR0_PLEO1|nr:hypothetical protein PLEOSDRAFT_1050810 [Pleurotus ostreatus PC15]
MSSETLKGKLALITGCTGGIGRATSLALARLGCSIAIHYHSAEDKAAALADELKAAGAQVDAKAFQADLSKIDDVRRLYADVVAQMGRPDILFNNAGISGPRIGPRGNIEDVSIEAFEHTWKANTGQAFLVLSQQVCVHMPWWIYRNSPVDARHDKATGGVIGPQYASSKSALHGLMHWVASRYAKDGIKLIPVNRFGVPEEVSSCVELLVTNAYMTNKVGNRSHVFTAAHPFTSIKY